MNVTGVVAALLITEPPPVPSASEATFWERPFRSRVAPLEICTSVVAGSKPEPYPGGAMPNHLYRR